MPIYQYQCQACGHQLEELQKVDDAALKNCPKCGQMSLHKQISAVGFQLKGSGWYVTDFKDKKPVAATDTSIQETGSVPTDTASKKNSETQADSKTSDSKTSDSKTNKSETTE